MKMSEDGQFRVEPGMKYIRELKTRGPGSYVPGFFCHRTRVIIKDLITQVHEGVFDSAWQREKTKQ